MLAVGRRLLAGFFAWLSVLKNGHNRGRNPEASGTYRLPLPPIMAMTLGAAALLAGCTQPTAIPDCAPSPGIHVVCGFAKPEDLAFLPGTDRQVCGRLSNVYESRARLLRGISETFDKCQRRMRTCAYIEA